MEYAIAGITAVFLFVYLMYALLRPERSKRAVIEVLR